MNAVGRAVENLAIEPIVFLQPLGGLERGILGARRPDSSLTCGLTPLEAPPDGHRHGGQASATSTLPMANAAAARRATERVVGAALEPRGLIRAHGATTLRMASISRLPVPSAMMFCAPVWSPASNVVTTRHLLFLLVGERASRSADARSDGSSATDVAALDRCRAMSWARRRRASRNSRWLVSR